MSGKNIIFDDKKSNFYKNKELFSLYNKILISKKQHFCKKAHSNTFLDKMMMMSLDLYV